MILFYTCNHKASVMVCLQKNSFDERFTHCFIRESFVHRFEIFRKIKETLSNIRERMQTRKENLFGNKQFSIDICKFRIGYMFFCINTFTFLLTCVQIQFQGSAREIEEQVKQHSMSSIL